MPANAYLALSEHQTGLEKQSLQLMAAGRFIYDGQWQPGQKLLANLDPMTPVIQDEKNLLLAKSYILRSQPRTAIQCLSKIKTLSALPLYYQVQYHDMLAYAYQLIQQPAASVRERIKLDALLPDETSKNNNRRALWLSLITISDGELRMINLEVDHHTLFAGWINLALVARKSYPTGQAMLTDIEHWQTEFPSHPAQKFFPAALETLAPALSPKPKHIALLLPLTGPLAGPGGAIRDGFMAAYDASGNTAFVSVQAYDTYIYSAANLYRRAVEQGADFIVGPLSKSDVAQVAGMPHPVPTLLLNEVESKSKAYTFGLSPVNEARQIAVRAGQAGHKRALIIVPEGSWGDDVLYAFSSIWNSQGGTLVETLHYGQTKGLNNSIRLLLHASAEPPKKINPHDASAMHAADAPLRRQDFDVIILVAYPSVARQIVPLIKYYYAGNIPIYATSNVYSGSPNAMKDRDLDGVIFCDMPGMFHAREISERNWPEPLNSYTRLYALGMDSFLLSQRMNTLLVFPAAGLNEEVLYLSVGNHIMRRLVFGQFKQGLATRLMP